MSNSLISLKCPRCGHVWREDVAKLEKLEQVIYRGAEPRPAAMSYRAKCPNDSTYIVVDVVEESGDE